ncbi:unnamed protein product [Rhizophagus irregularis]|nr:unnamed protein product [Rhizophagus irregularis]
MPEYIELMKRCWNNDPEKRPTANELSNIFLKWSIKYPIEEDKEKRIPIPENEPEIISIQNELSNNIVIINDKNDDGISKELDELDELDDFII